MSLLNVLAFFVAGLFAVWGVVKTVRLAEDEQRHRSLLSLGGTEVPFRVPEGPGVMRRVLRSRITIAVFVLGTILWFLSPLFLQRVSWFREPFFWVVPAVLLWLVPDFLRSAADVSIWRLGDNGLLARGRIWSWENIQVQTLQEKPKGFLLTFRSHENLRAPRSQLRIRFHDLDPETVVFLEGVAARRLG